MFDETQVIGIIIVFLLLPKLVSLSIETPEDLHLPQNQDLLALRKHLIGQLITQIISLAKPYRVPCWDMSANSMLIESYIGVFNKSMTIRGNIIKIIVICVLVKGEVMFGFWVIVFGGCFGLAFSS